MISNIFMTIAWYGHLRFTNRPLWAVIIISWLIASVEYCFQVPANRLGVVKYHFTPVQLKVMAEICSLLAFSLFSVVYLKEVMRWNYVVAFCFLVGAVFFVFHKW
jgi:uncharacterized protein (DUF486 family)